MQEREPVAPDFGVWRVDENFVEEEVDFGAKRADTGLDRLTKAPLIFVE